MNTNPSANQFTAQQLKDWKAYERVRKTGRYNMYDPRARQATKLSGERYSFVMQNFSKLKTVAGEQAKTQTQNEHKPNNT